MSVLNDSDTIAAIMDSARLCEKFRMEVLCLDFDKLDPEAECHVLSAVGLLQQAEQAFRLAKIKQCSK